MGAFSDLDAYLNAVANGIPYPTIKVATAAIPSGKSVDAWAALSGSFGVAPTTGVAVDRTTTGAIGQHNGGSGDLFVSAINGADAPNLAESWILCDRLSHSGGLSATVTGSQSTNLPTAALTRYTDGVGVMLGLTVYTQIGATATTITASYTDNDGNSGQTTPAMLFGGTSNRELGRLMMMPLAPGDTGVRAVASVNVLATTGTAGNFGVTLFKPLVAVYFNTMTPRTLNVFDGMMGGLPVIQDDACLFWVVFTGTTATSTAPLTPYFAVA